MAENDVFGSASADNGSPEAVQEDLNALRADLAKLSEAVAQLVREQTSAQAEKVRDAVGTARETLTGAADSSPGRGGHRRRHPGQARNAERRAGKVREAHACDIRADGADRRRDLRNHHAPVSGCP